MVDIGKTIYGLFEDIQKETIKYGVECIRGLSRYDADVAITIAAATIAGEFNSLSKAEMESAISKIENLLNSMKKDLNS